MKILQVGIDPARVPEALAAITPFACSAPILMQVQPLPEEAQDEQEFEELAVQVADAIQPTGNQPMRRTALQACLGGHDTFLDQMGDPDPSLRNAMGALSKALRPFSVLASPLDLICTRIKEYFAEGQPGAGGYRGTRYVPTKLGRRVYAILKARGVLR
ncbi:hypothetical protein H7F51_11040 [Novosphingobium flavum]|uniref:Uncharacterized protein n=1 Tax=Novosphingobium flavum TaxID=1778672 RepID=A0A7X1FTG9_9SPHN|nr:hypothetical protein [Novosphingobium flavum]MBC2666052.1 hypothetical protein [Novosphingobium flavum]